MTNNNLPQPTDVGFAQFTATLIAETLDAILTAQLDQEHKARELLAAVEMDPVRFAEEYIPQEKVDDELCRLFPSGQLLHSVIAGAPYRPEAEGQIEDPPIRQKTGYIMSRGDFGKRGEAFIITERGYQNISARVRMALAAEQRADIIGMAHRGVPRIVVDSGRVNTKLTFQLSQQEADGVEQTATAGIAGTGGIKAAELSPLDRLIAPATGLRLKVRPVDPRHPEVTNLSANVVGEVEISFKTVFE